LSLVIENAPGRHSPAYAFRDAFLIRIYGEIDLAAWGDDDHVGR
jgi:hypothetical protein